MIANERETLAFYSRKFDVYLIVIFGCSSQRNLDFSPSSLLLDPFDYLYAPSINISLVMFDFISSTSSQVQLNLP